MPLGAECWKEGYSYRACCRVEGAEDCGSVGASVLGPLPTGGTFGSTATKTVVQIVVTVWCLEAIQGPNAV